MNRPLGQLAEIAQQAVSIGGELIGSRRPHTVTEKSERDTYTDVDVYIERQVRRYLASVTPDIGFIGEEEGLAGRHNGNAFMWTLDPIDGTANFVHNIPLCATQLALIHEGRAIVAAICLPYLETQYWAAEGMGSYVNGSRMQVSQTTELSSTIVSLGDYATGDQAVEKNERRVSLTATIASTVERVRMFGSAAHDFAWLAEGRTDATVILSNNLLDVAAGVLLTREAGGLVTDTSGLNHSESSADIVAANPRIHEKLMQLIHQ